MVDSRGVRTFAHANEMAYTYIRLRERKKERKEKKIGNRILQRTNNILKRTRLR